MVSFFVFKKVDYKVGRKKFYNIRDILEIDKECGVYYFLFLGDF